MTRIALSFLMLTLLPISVSAVANPFSLLTADGKTHLTGQIDHAECGMKPSPAVLIVGGSGLFSRNGYFGQSGTKRDFLFADLAERFNKKCITVIRFDYRGVSCDLTDLSKLKTCVDQNVRESVTDQTMLDDIQTVYDFAAADKSISIQNLYAIGHSEGSLNLARLIDAKKINPSGLLFIGGVTESPKSIGRWQSVERFVELAFEMDLNHDGLLTNDEIKVAFKGSRLSKLGPIESILSPTGSWTKESLTAVLEENYLEAAKEALAHLDTDPYLSGGVTLASYKWRKRWFTDAVSVLDQLKSFAGPIKYHNGDIDTQTPGVREDQFLKGYPSPLSSRPIFVVHQGKGHGLSSDPLYGPIDESIADGLVDDIGNWINAKTPHVLRLISTAPHGARVAK